MEKGNKFILVCFFVLILGQSLEIEINMISQERQTGELPLAKSENLKGSIRIDVESTNYTYPLGTRGASFIIKAGANFTNNQKSTQGHISVEVSSVDGCKNQQQGIVTNLSMTRYVASQYCKLGNDPLVADTSFRVYAQAWMDTGESTYGYGDIKIKVNKTLQQENNDLASVVRIDNITNFTYTIVQGMKNFTFPIQTMVNFTNTGKSTQAHVTTEISSIPNCKGEFQALIAPNIQTPYAAFANCTIQGPIMDNITYRVYGQGWMDTGENSYNYGQITLKVLKFSQDENNQIQKQTLSIKDF